jgi:glutathione S-transferase
MQMVKLLNSDILTTEVLEWKGLHLFHFPGSSCSQKTRILLSEKGVEWESHSVNLMMHENFTHWFLGINPRGLVPVIVHDGEVHIESNDIMRYIDDSFVGPILFPKSKNSIAYMDHLAKVEDDLHLHLRALTFRYIAPNELLRKDPEALDIYETAGSGYVNGNTDERKSIEVNFWRKMAVDGIPTKQAIAAINSFEPHLTEINIRLGNNKWLLPEGFSALDIMWWINTYRLKLLGYPFDKFLNINTWHERLEQRPNFSKEVAMPPERLSAIKKHQEEMANNGESLPQLMAKQ